MTALPGDEGKAVVVPIRIQVGGILCVVNQQLIHRGLMFLLLAKVLITCRIF